MNQKPQLSATYFKSLHLNKGINKKKKTKALPSSESNESIHTANAFYFRRFSGA